MSCALLQHRSRTPNTFKPFSIRVCACKLPHFLQTRPNLHTRALLSVDRFRLCAPFCERSVFSASRTHTHTPSRSLDSFHFQFCYWVSPAGVGLLWLACTPNVVIARNRKCGSLIGCFAPFIGPRNRSAVHSLPPAIHHANYFTE